MGIYAYRYGYIPTDERVSITEAEYVAATAAGLKRFIYLVDDSMPWIPAFIDKGDAEAKLNELKKKLKENHMCGFYSSESELAAKVAADLGRYFSLQNLQPVAAADAGDIDLSSPNELRTIEEWNKHRQGIYDRNRKLFLVHVISPSKTKGQLFDIYIYLKRHQATTLTDVDHAEFFLGKYWGNKVFYVQSENDYIGIATSAYGSFLCDCRVTFKDGYQIYISRYIDLEMAVAFQ